MSLIWTKKEAYRRTGYRHEADLEAAILEVQPQLFGPQQLYLDVKKNRVSERVRDIMHG